MFLCPICSNNLSTDFDLMTHLKCLHKLEMNNPCNCPYDDCFRSFSNVYAYRKHCNQIHNRLIDNKKKSKPIDVINSVVRCQDKNLYNIEENPIENPIENLPIEKPLVIFEVNNENKIDISKFSYSVNKQAAILVAQLYGELSVSRSFANDILSCIHQFYHENCIENLKTRIKNCDCSSRKEISEMLEIIHHSLDNFKTEHLTLKYFTDLGVYIEPQSFVIQSSLKLCREKNLNKTKIIKSNIEIVPMDLMLKEFLELPNVFNYIISFIKKQEKQTIIESVFQTEIWKNIKRIFLDKIVFPLILYFDDVEINNPLGTNRGIKNFGLCIIQLQEYLLNIPVSWKIFY